MHQSLVTALLAVAPLVASVPLEPRGNVRFTVDQVAARKVYKSGAQSYQQSLGKYKANIPNSVSNAAASASGSATTTPEANDQEYLTPVQIGTPAQTLNLDFDTGSSDLWVFSSETSSNERSGHSYYTPSRSSTSKELTRESWEIQYGDGSTAAGNVYADKVVVGGVTATSQAVEAATTVAQQFVQDTQNDGLLGLGFSNINTVTPNQQSTFFDTVKSTLAQGLFTALLKHAAPGSYDFGFIDNSKYTGDITYVDIDSSNGWYEFDAGDIAVDGRSAGTIGDAIADTGTSLILISDAATASFYRNIEGAENNQQAGGYTVPCSGNPDFTINVGGTDFTIPGEYLAYASNGDGTCFGGVQSNQGLQQAILGDVFLKSVFTVFDAAGSRVGFATQA
ncbi:MAG: Type I transmembrane sorting receptor [Chrysothrix sp. TS-e1954]|nr:MAG: Type I transmembrane sorting receptor [Chrysothrix sp. TS-e1954]